MLMKSYLILILVNIFTLQLVAQIKIERPGNPDVLLHNTNAHNTDVSSRLMFKSGSYYTGALSTIGTSATSARLSFFTQATADQNALLERMTILNNGYIGIGTNNPQYNFHLKTNGLGFTVESLTGQAQIGFYTNTSVAYLQTHNNIPLHFATNNANAQMTLTTAGRFGIGTQLPVSKLEVRGKTTIVQQAGEDSALEIQGTLKLGGANPIAFQAVAASPNYLKIDHPHCNNNQNAILMVTPVKKFSDDGDIAGQFKLVYESGGFWYLYPVGAEDFDFQQRFNILILN